MAAVVIAVVGVAVVLVRSGGEDYTVKLRFQNASQLVKGSPVQVSGKSVGEVTDIELTDDGQAVITASIKDEWAPLRTNTQATVRLYSLSGIANRYIDLRMGSGSGKKIPDGGTIPESQTTTAVDLDEIFNVFDKRTRAALSGFIRGSATQYAGQGEAANRGWLYLNPALASSSRLFRELNSDTDLLQRFIVASADLVTDLADRQQDLAGLVDNLATTTGALANQRTALAEAIRRFPDFMRRSNTTFVNLRALLDDLDPLVAESKPVAKKLIPFLADLRGFARDARPTVRDLSGIVRRPGKGNDLIDLTGDSIPLRDVAVGPIQRNGAKRDGALPASTKALRQATPELAFARPYAPDLTGWFNDFGSSGIYDALGAESRPALHVNAFALTGSLSAGGLGDLLGATPLGTLVPLPPELRQRAFQSLATLRQDDRCPGSMERPESGSGNPFRPTSDYPCDPTQLPPGP
jgi:phospholipid/cholesterol/gamma-HCH transport system substrate-binding protein